MSFFPQQKSLTVGGVVFTDLDNLIILGTQVTTTGTFSTYRKLNATVDYTPSVAKSFRIWAGKGQASGGSAEIYTILYGDTSLGNNSAGPAVNPVYPTGYGAAAAYPYMFESRAIGGNTGSGEFGWGKAGFLVPNAKYLYATSGTAVAQFLYIYGYEE